MAKRKPPTKRKLVKKLDAVFSKWVRYSAVNKFGYVPCYTCRHQAEAKRMQAGHYIPRQHMVTRWEPMNVHPQCYACNMYYGGRPQNYRDHLIEDYGIEQVEDLEQRRHRTKQWDRDDIEHLIEFYSMQLRTIN